MTHTPTNGELVAKDAATKLGVQLSPSGLANVAAQIDTLSAMTPGAPVMVGDVPVVDWLAAQLAGSPTWTQGPPTAKTRQMPTGNLTERGLAYHATRRSTEGKADKARKAAEAGNPWKSSTLNRTSQAIIQNCDPALADRLRSEAAL